MEPDVAMRTPKPVAFTSVTVRVAPHKSPSAPREVNAEFAQVVPVGVKVLDVPAITPAFSRVAVMVLPLLSLSLGSTRTPVMVLPAGMLKPKPVRSMV